MKAPKRYLRGAADGKKMMEADGVILFSRGFRPVSAVTKL
jgi:hypothetical protein